MNIKQSHGLRVRIDTTRSRQTAKTDFGSVLSTGLSKTANTVMSASKVAAPFIPGAAVVSAAISGLSSLSAKQSGGGMASGANSVSLSAPGRGSSASVSGAASSSGVMQNIEAMAESGDSGAMQLLATKEMQAMNQSFNLQYLQLQQEMQQENRKFSTLSNIMKTKHDTAKSTINNVR